MVKMIDLGELSNRPKASEVFLEFSRPALEILPKNASIGEMKSVCKFCEAVWNAITVGNWPNCKYEDPLMQLKECYDSKTEVGQNGLKLIDILVEQKNLLFSDANWAFEIEVRESGDEDPFIVRAFVRLPDELIPKVSPRWRHLAAGN